MRHTQSPQTVGVEIPTRKKRRTVSWMWTRLLQVTLTHAQDLGAFQPVNTINEPSRYNTQSGYRHHHRSSTVDAHDFNSTSNSFKGPPPKRQKTAHSSPIQPSSRVARPRSPLGDAFSPKSNVKFHDKPEDQEVRLGKASEFRSVNNMMDPRPKHDNGSNRSVSSGETFTIRSQSSSRENAKPSFGTMMPKSPTLPKNSGRAVEGRRPHSTPTSAQQSDHMRPTSRVRSLHAASIPDKVLDEAQQRIKRQPLGQSRIVGSDEVPLRHTFRRDSKSAESSPAPKNTFIDSLSAITPPLQDAVKIKPTSRNGDASRAPRLKNHTSGAGRQHPADIPTTNFQSSSTRRVAAFQVEAPGECDAKLDYFADGRKRCEYVSQEYKLVAGVDIENKIIYVRRDETEVLNIKPGELTMIHYDNQDQHRYIKLMLRETGEAYPFVLLQFSGRAGLLDFIDTMEGLGPGMPKAHSKPTYVHSSGGAWSWN